jgi:hypothetical protein
MAKDTEMSLVAGVPTLKTTSDNVEAFTNVTDAVSVGDAVYVSGNGSVALADNTDTSKEAVGLVFEVTDSTNCRVITGGLLPGFSERRSHDDQAHRRVVRGGGRRGV